MGAYRDLLDRKSLPDRLMRMIVERDSSGEVLGLLSRIRETERINLELRVAQASKISPQDVTTEHVLSYYDLLSEQDASLQRIARANCKRLGRKLLKKFHPDTGEGSDAELFALCKSAINSGDVELVYILLYRLDGHVVEAPEVILNRLRVRIIQAEGSRVFSLFRLYFTAPYDHFLSTLIKFLEARLLTLQLMNIPSAQEPLGEEYEPDEN